MHNYLPLAHNLDSSAKAKCCVSRFRVATVVKFKTPLFLLPIDIYQHLRPSSSASIDMEVDISKLAYKKRLAEAVAWLQGEGYEEKPATAARTHRVNAASIRASLKLANRRHQMKGQGGHNWIPLDTQTKVIEAYCYEQWELGMGATKQMVFAAICFLVYEQGKEPPS